MLEQMGAGNSNMTAIMGGLSLQSPKQSKRIIKVINHRLFVGRNKWEYNFALVQLAADVQVSDEVQPIRLPRSWQGDSMRNKTGAVLRVAGFGAVSGGSDRSLSPQLKETNLTVT